MARPGPSDALIPPNPTCVARSNAVTIISFTPTARFVLSTRLSCHWAEPSEWLEAIDYLKENRINRILFIMGGVHGTVEQLYGPDHDFDRYDVEKFQAIDRFIDCLRRADILASP
jgi:hypothetical protein